MKRVTLLVVGLLLFALVGCGVNKDYVDQQIKESEARTSTKMAKMQADNETEIQKLRDLAAKLSSKTDMAINKASGFENYQINWTGEINFDVDSYEINDAAAAILSDAGEKLEQNPSAIIEMAGHSDRTGKARYNLMLGEKRADAAKRFLADRFGTSLYRMFTISYGSERPVAMPDERGAAGKNRRVTLKIWGPM